MIGIWMRVPDAIGPIEGIRVFVTLDALWNLDSSAVRDLYSAVDIFDLHHGKVELAASRKLDDRGPEEGEEHEGRPIIVLTSYELSQLPRESAER
jgi:hypothetical protein